MTLHTQTLSGSNVCISTAIYLIIPSHCLCPSQLSLSLFGTDWPHSSPFRPEGFLPRVRMSLTHLCLHGCLCALPLVVKMWCWSLPHLPPWKSVHWRHLLSPLPSTLVACAFSLRSTGHHWQGHVLWRGLGVVCTDTTHSWHCSRRLDRDQCGQISADCTGTHRYVRILYTVHYCNYIIMYTQQ